MSYKWSYKIKLNSSYDKGDLIIYKYGEQVGFIKERFDEPMDIVDYYFDHWVCCSVVNEFDELLVDKQVKELYE